MTDTTEIAELQRQMFREQRDRRMFSRQLAVAIRALRWYGDEDNYYDPPGAPGHLAGEGIDEELVRDYGERAREALAEIYRLES